MEYHLSVAGTVSGPHTRFHLIEGIRDGTFKGDEFAWRSGMIQWEPLRLMEDFRSYWPPTPDMLAEAEKARCLARAGLDRPQPWLRFWARVLDGLWFLLTLRLVLWMVLPPGADVRLQQATHWHALLDAAAFLLYVPVEAWLLARCGTTPGRALLRIQVRRLDGALPTYAQALRRSLHVYVMGLGLALPLVSLCTLVWWRAMLPKRGATLWDERNGTRVEHGEPELWRLGVLAGILFIMFLFLLAAIHGMAESTGPAVP